MEVNRAVMVVFVVEMVVFGGRTLFTTLVEVKGMVGVVIKSKTAEGYL